MHVRADHSVAANPHVVSNGHFLAILPQSTAHIRIYRMTRCVYLYIWRHETIVTYGHLYNIKDCTVIICKEVLAHFYM